MMIKITNNDNDAKAILEEASEHTGWGLTDMLNIVCKYLNDLDEEDTLDMDEFKTYIEELVNKEL